MGGGRTRDSAVLPWSSPGDEAMHLGITILSLVNTGYPPMCAQLRHPAFSLSKVNNFSEVSEI